MKPNIRPDTGYKKGRISGTTLSFIGVRSQIRIQLLSAIRIRYPDPPTKNERDPESLQVSRFTKIKYKEPYRRDVSEYNCCRFRSDNCPWTVSIHNTHFYQQLDSTIRSLPRKKTPKILSPQHYIQQTLSTALWDHRLNNRSPTCSLTAAVARARAAAAS